MVTTPVVRWTVTDWKWVSLNNKYVVILATDIPVHMWLQGWSRKGDMHLVAITDRGVMFRHNPRWTVFTTWGYEQAEPGDTLAHTFTIDPDKTSSWRAYSGWATWQANPTKSTSPLFQTAVPSDPNWIIPPSPYHWSRYTWSNFAPYSAFAARFHVLSPQWVNTWTAEITTEYGLEGYVSIGITEVVNFLPQGLGVPLDTFWLSIPSQGHVQQFFNKAFYLSRWKRYALVVRLLAHTPGSAIWSSAWDPGSPTWPTNVNYYTRDMGATWQRHSPLMRPFRFGLGWQTIE
ncbi:hypothetical protein LCGC14_1285810 [marine sediment metagenome]|uniref:Uncharacterized protein n=1 Tax=marine sediment metagenome TaxID=412755 RepID=A0A0F9LEX9_9ZZZZ